MAQRRQGKDNLHSICCSKEGLESQRISARIGLPVGESHLLVELAGLSNEGHRQVRLRTGFQAIGLLQPRVEGLDTLHNPNPRCSRV
jgi:hypothetical protein